MKGHFEFIAESGLRWQSSGMSTLKAAEKSARRHADGKLCAVTVKLADSSYFWIVKPGVVMSGPNCQPHDTLPAYAV